ncbi:MAG TPA: hypothetical protein VD884_05440 [Ohtaekwangia sp.]|nr:hypothetical protein [Ohtaekwangia sp.]
MIVLRVLVLVFNVVVVGYLIFHMLQVAREPVKRSKKTMILIGGVMLLLAPFGMFLGFFAPTMQYFFIYPLAIGLFLYLTKKL